MDEKELLKRYKELFPHLDKKQKRLLAAVDAEMIGRGGITKVSKASKISRVTIHKAIKEKNGKNIIKDRIRQEGGGRKSYREKQPEVEKKLEALVSPKTKGDPMGALKWTCKSTRQLSKELLSQGHKVSFVTVSNLLRGLGYSLQANMKVITGKKHPDRNAQFEHISNEVDIFLKEQAPVISVDTKKKELVGHYQNKGKEWHKKGHPERVLDHDFPNKDLGKAIPYGIYDIGKNLGWVNVGCDYDTSAFAVESIRRWWFSMGKVKYPETKKLLITADSGGSNGYRRRLWKTELQKLVNETGLDIKVCHFPPGTSKWNKIEHRLFSYISMNWRGKPLVSHEVIVNLIGSTTTSTGLKVHAAIDTSKYPKKIKITDEELEKVNLIKDSFHGEWNYTISCN